MAEPGTLHGHSGRHEHGDVPAGPLVKLGLALLTLMGGSLVLVAWLLLLFSSRPSPDLPRPSPMVKQGQLPPPPRLQVAPPEDLRALRNAEDGIINSYAWVDRDAGSVRIPIERAMQLMSQRSLPVRSASSKAQVVRGEEEKKR